MEGLIAGDERFMSAEDMESRFALVIGMCLSGAATLIGIVLLYYIVLMPRNTFET